MAKNYNNMYNYETSPKKIQPEYAPQRNTKKNKNINTTKKQNNKVQEQKLKEKQKKKQQRKIIIYISLGFIILFAISYRNSEIDEAFSQMQQLKGELATVEKENEQLKVNIENGSNLNNLEQLAKELFGMQKLTNKQSIYVSLPKVDYIESSKNRNNQKENTFESISKNVLNIF